MGESGRAMIVARLACVLAVGLLAAGCAAARAPLAADEVDRSCRSDADCAVKNVGNCCGYYPACVNRGSPVFPERVKAECLAKNMSGICGFPDIKGCACVAGSCTDVRELPVE